MSSYSGNFTVTNAGTGAISGTVTHVASGQQPTTCTFSNLNPGQTTPPVQYFTESSSVDQWYYNFSRGGTQYEGQKDCGVESADVTVGVSLSNTYIVNVPSESSPCTGSLSTNS